MSLLAVCVCVLSHFITGFASSFPKTSERARTPKSHHQHHHHGHKQTNKQSGKQPTKQNKTTTELTHRPLTRKKENRKKKKEKEKKTSTDGERRATQTEDGWTQGLALTAAVGGGGGGGVYPFGLGLWRQFHLRLGLRPAARRRVRQVDLHVVRHFFEKVGGDKAPVAIDLTLEGGGQRGVQTGEAQ